MVQEHNRIDSRRARCPCPYRLPRPAANRGFSLLELVLVLGIIAILAAIALPRYSAATSRYQVDLAACRMVQDLALAQAAAQAQGATQRVRIDQGTDQIVLLDTAALDPHMPTYRTYLSDSPYEVDVSSSEFDADDYVIFDGWGLPDSGGTAVLTLGSETRTITVDPNTGKASIE